jgi:hypothetical protein
MGQVPCCSGRLLKHLTARLGDYIPVFKGPRIASFIVCGSGPGRINQCCHMPSAVSTALGVSIVPGKYLSGGPLAIEEPILRYGAGGSSQGSD